MVKWLKRAVGDLDEVEEYIAKDNPDAAIDTVLAIISAVQQLEEFSGMGRPGRIAGTRELIIDGLPFIVPYRLRGETIEILRVQVQGGTPMKLCVVLKKQEVSNLNIGPK